MANYTKKPIPDESIFKHLRMLAGYCHAQAATDKAPKRKKLLDDLALKFDKLSESKVVKELQLYGE